jgi:hypothetical protein
MNPDRSTKPAGVSFLRGLLQDFTELAVILVFVLFLTIIMGLIFVFVAIEPQRFVYIGIFFSILLVPVVIILGLFLNTKGYRSIPVRERGFWKYFQVSEVSFSQYSTRYRNEFILQRMTFLGIMVILFFFFLFISGLMTLDVVCCCIFFPIAIPSILITVTIPAIAWISYTYAFDPYEPEPRALIVIGVLWGMMSTFPSLFFNTFNSFWMEDLGLSTAVFSAPVVEEFFKSIGFLIIFTQVKDETDGLIYGEE